MSVPLFTGPVPNRLSSPATFSADTDSYHAELAGVIAGMNLTATAMNLNSTTDTSVSSVAIGTGSKSFTVSSSKSFQAGMWLILASTAAPTVNYLVAQIDSYNTGTGALVVVVPSNGAIGSGTIASWVISQTSQPSSAISGAMQPVTSAASLAAGRTAFGVPTAGILSASGITGAAVGLQSIDYSLAANAMTLKLNPTVLDFRSTTLSSGAITSVVLASQISTVISSGSTAGATSGVQSEIVLLAINTAGTIELAWTNRAGGLRLDGQNLITTVAEGGAGAADSISTIYSTTARTGVAYRVVGFIRSTQTTAGTWAQTPTLVQGAGPADPVSKPKFSAYLSANQSIANTTFVKLQFNTEEFDTHGFYDSSTNYRFQPTEAGFYHITSAANFSTTSASVTLIYKNGVRFKDGSYASSATGGTTSVSSALVFLNGTGDYVEIFAYQGSGAAVNVLGEQAYTYFQAHEVV